MKHPTIYPLFFFLMIFMVSCNEDQFTQVVEIDLPEHEPMLALSAHFSNYDTVNKVVISKTWGLETPPDTPFVTDATVKLYRDGNLVSSFDYSESGWEYLYRNHSPLPWQPDGSVYRLEVSAPGFATISAEQRIPSVIPIEKATYEKQGTISPDGEKVDELVVEFNDPAGEENYYGIRAYAVTYYYDEFGDTVFHHDRLYLESVDPLAEIGEGDIMLLSDGSFDGKKEIFRSYFYSQGEISKIQVHLIHFTKEKYLYLRSLRQYYNAKDNPFAEPVTVFSNVENGTGLFSLESISITEFEP